MTGHRNDKVTRRSILRGAIGGASVTLGIPILDALLNESGTAFASGAPLPVRFGTWFYGLGHTLGRGIEAKEGANFEFANECLPLEPFRQEYINYFNGFNIPLDGNPSPVHYTGWVAMRTGSSPKAFGDIPSATYDTLIADEIGGRTRFKSVELACTGNPAHSYSYQGPVNHNPAEVSPLQFYLRLFGPSFQDPNSTEFVPDPRVILRQSILSSVGEQRAELTSAVGQADKQRLDQYFTSIRELETQLDVELTRPEMEACFRPDQPEEEPLDNEYRSVAKRHETMARILTLALACDRTRVFNMMYSEAASEVRIEGVTFHHHNLSHQEPVDGETGYQMQTAWLNEKSYVAFSRMLQELASVQEGDGTLLDNILIVAETDTSDAKSHNINGIPVITAGKAGGRLKTGNYINGSSGPISRIGLTAMQVMGVPVSEWGTRSLATGDPITQILA